MLLQTKARCNAALDVFAQLTFGRPRVKNLAKLEALLCRQQLFPVAFWCVEVEHAAPGFHLLQREVPHVGEDEQDLLAVVWPRPALRVRFDQEDAGFGIRCKRADAIVQAVVGHEDPRSRARRCCRRVALTHVLKKTHGVHSLRLE